MHHLLRSALIGFLLAIYVNPFALAEPTGPRKSDERFGSRIPQPWSSKTALPVVRDSPTPSCTSIVDEGFNNIGDLPGWVLINHSQPLGRSDWLQGNDVVFLAFDG